MPKIAESSIQEVAAANDIVEIVGSYIALKRAGSAFKALCPFHREKTPSFFVNPARQTFHCFGCGAGGGVIRFVMDYEHLSFTDAVRKLADRAGIRLVYEESTGEPEGTSRDERARLMAIHREAAAWFAEVLLRGKRGAAARKYLSERGVNREIAVAWGLGYAPDPKVDGEGGGACAYLQSKGYTAKELLVAGIAMQSDRSSDIYDRFRGRIMIPIHNENGDVIAFSGRVIDPSTSPAKYVNSPETPIFSKGKVLFGLHKTKRELIETDKAIVCEGQFDLISLYEAGVKNVIAPQGTAFTPYQAMLLKRFVSEVILCFDSDAAGRKAAERSIPSLLEKELQVKVLELPSGEDPDSLVRREGGEAFLARVATAPDFLSAKLRAARDSGVLEEPEGVARVAKELAALFQQIPDPVLREGYINIAAAELRIPPAQLHSLVRNVKKVPTADVLDEATEPSASPLSLSPAVETLCKLALYSPEARAWLAKRTELPCLHPAREFLLLSKILAASELENPAAFLATLPAEFQPAIARIDARHLPKNPVHVAAEIWKGLCRKHYQDQIEATKSRLLGKNLPQSEILNIQKELLDLQRKLLEVSSPNFAFQSA
jgi:DNA primase